MNTDQMELQESEFVMTEFGTFFVKNQKLRRLANFSARVREQVYLCDADASQDTLVHFVLEVKTSNNTRTLVVPVLEFDRMGWIVRLGTDAIVAAGHATRDMLRQAILEHSVDAKAVYRHSHLGWTTIEGRSVYLHASGGITSGGVVDGVEVEVEDALRPFELPELPEGAQRRRVLKNVLSILEFAPMRCTVPVLASVFSAPLGHARHTVHLYGVTGAKKTEVAALAQRFFGKSLDATNLPFGWNATDNGLLRPLYQAKDTLTVLDDFCPHGTASNPAMSNRLADRVIRSQANRQGRARLRPDGTLREIHRPRGTILSTGEAIPAGKSLVARMLCVRFESNDVDNDKLTTCQNQAAAGDYAAAMACFVAWLADSDRLDSSRRLIEERCIEWRVRGDFDHGRQPDIAGRLDAAFEIMLAFLQDSKIVTPEEVELLLNDARDALATVCQEHAQELRNADPVRRWVECISSLLVTARVHLEGTDGLMPAGGSEWGWLQDEEGRVRPGGPTIGWIDQQEGVVLLDPDATYQAVRRYAESTGQSIGVGPKVLNRALKERGLLVKTDSDRCTFKATVRGRRKNVLALSPELFREEKEFWNAPEEA